MHGAVDRLTALLGPPRVLTGADITEDDWHDESLSAHWHAPDVVVLPHSATEVADIIRIARELGAPVTARGSGTGLAGACVPRDGGILIAFREMDAILEIDVDNQLAVVQPGVTLRQLDEATAAHGLVYPVYPGESSASVGGSVATNAGGMRAVKYGVTRQQVLGLEAVLGTGEIVRTGGKFVKSTSGYDLTQLIVGSEGTLAVVTEAIVRLYPRHAHAATVLAPFRTVAEIASAVPKIVQSGVAPLILEYIDMMSMAAITGARGLELGIGQEVKDAALAYLVVVLESRDQGRLDEDIERLGDLITNLGALDVYVLPPRAATELIEARERAFFAAKAAGANEIVDTVVPRAQIPEFLSKVAVIAAGLRLADHRLWPRGRRQRAPLRVSVRPGSPRRGLAERLRGRGIARWRHLRRARHRHRQAQPLPRARGPGKARAHGVASRPHSIRTASSTRACSSSPHTIEPERRRDDRR